VRSASPAGEETANEREVPKGATLAVPAENIVLASVFESDSDSGA